MDGELAFIGVLSCFGAVLSLVLLVIIWRQKGSDDED